MRIPSTVPASNVAPLAAAQSSASGSSFLELLTSASLQGTFGSSSMGAKTPAGEREANPEGGEREEQSGHAIRDARTAEADSAAGPKKASSEERPSEPGNIHGFSRGSSGVATGERGGATPTETNEDLSAQTTASNAAQAPLAQVVQPGSAVQGALSNASESEISADGLKAPGAKTLTAPSAANRAVSKPQQAPSFSVRADESARAPETVQPADSDNAMAEEKPSGQEIGLLPGAGSIGTCVVPAFIETATSTKEARQSTVASPSGPNAVASERTGTPPKALNPTLAVDGADDGGADGELAAPVAASGAPQFEAYLAASGAAAMLPQQLNLPTAGALTNAGSSAQLADGATSKATVDGPGAKNPLLANAPDGSTNSTAGSTSAPSDASSHSAQNNGPSPQNAPADASQAAAITPKVADSGAAQIQTLAQTVVNQAAPHATAVTHRPADGADAAPRSSDAQELAGTTHADGGDAIATSGINATKLMQTMNETEMRVGMSSSEFGDISIRTSISQEQMLAHISLDHGELSQAIAAHIPTVQTKLGQEYGLQASILVNHSGSSLSGESGQSSQREQRGFSRPAPMENVAAVAEEDSTPMARALASAEAGSGYRLDIRA